MNTRRSRPSGALAASAILAIAATTVGAPAAAQSPGASPAAIPDCSGKTVGATLLSLQYPFLVTLNDSMAAEAAALGVNLVSLDPRQKTDTELTQIEDLITQQVDAIIMIPVDVTNSQTAAKAVNAAGIPLIEVNTKLDRSFFDAGGTIATYVGSDDVQAGKIQGQYVVDTLGETASIIYLVGQYGGASTNLRKEGFTEVLSQHPGITIATELEGHGSRAEGKTIMEDLLQRYGEGEIQGVVSQNDEMALGALSAIEAAGRRAEFTIIMGLDAQPEALQSIKDGGLTASVFQDATGQGIGAIQAACMVLAGQEVPPVTDIPFQLVTAETVDQYME